MTTQPRIILLVVISIAVLAAFGLGAICWCSIHGRPACESLVTITSSLTGALTALLVSTRSASPDDKSSPDATQTKNQKDPNSP